MINTGRKFDKFKLYYYGYLYFWIKYFSFKKMFNVLLNIYEYKTKKAIVKSVPPIVHMDVSNICVLHCPLCATGRGGESQTKTTMTFEQFKNIFDKFKDYTFFVWLYNWGEPFLCKDIFKAVDYCHKNNVGVKLDSNLNYYDDKILENIAKSKIDYISLSIDGFTQEKYQFYRKGGNLKKVLEGIKKIRQFKKKFDTKFPVLVWQFLINNQNISEVESAYHWSKENKVDIFEARPLSLFTDVDSGYNKKDYDEFLSKTGVTKEMAKKAKEASACRYLWDSFAVNPDNSFSPCPIVYKDTDCFGVFRKKDARGVNEIVNSEIFVESRNLYKYKSYKTDCHTPCIRCNWYTKPS